MDAKSQTAVEWLIEIYLTTGIDRNVHFHQAKAMEREQIVKAVNDSWNMAKHSNFADAQAEQYYTQTYNK